MTTATREVTVRLPDYSKHFPQSQFIPCQAKRIIIRAGRRGGKTTGIAIKMVERFLDGRRQSYGAPTLEQVEACWFEICRALREPIGAGVFKKNEAEHTIEKPGTKQRIKCRTVWNADSMRGDYGDDLYFDEWQLSDESAWEEVGLPMLLDNNGTATFIYTPPSLRSQSVSKARDPRHAAKMFKMAQADTTGLWQTYHFTSWENPYISHEALEQLSHEMSQQTYRQEILAEDDEVQASWLVHSKFNEQLCKIKRFPIPTNWDVFSGHDFGAANPACLFAARVKLPLPDGAPPYMRLNDLVFWREYAPGPGFSTAQHVARFKELTIGYHIARSRGGNLNSEDEIRQGYTKEGWLILPPALEKKNTQIDRMINLEENNKLYIFEDMWQTLSQMANCLWKLKDGVVTNEIDNEAIYHLASACLRYILSDSDFTPETVVQSTGSRQTGYMGSARQVRQKVLSRR